MFLRADKRIGSQKQQKRDLHHQHPATAQTQKRQAYRVQEWRPDKFPSVGKTNQGKQANGLQINLFEAQPRWNQAV